MLGGVNGLALNLLLALIWALLLGEVTLRTLGLGFGVGYVLLRVFRGPLGTRRYARAVPGLLGLGGFFMSELVLANLRLAGQALSPRPTLTQMVVAVPLRPHSAQSLTLLVSLTGLLPGTVTLGISPDRRTLYVHSAGLPDRQSVRKSVQDLERRLAALGRRSRPGAGG